MNASDIIKRKQNRTLHKAYYPTTFYESTIFSTLYPHSFIESNISYTSCINTVYTYNPSKTTIPQIPFISYELSRDIYNKKISNMTWKANPIIQTESYASNDASIISANGRAMRPLICTSLCKQGTNFDCRCTTTTCNTCNTCN